jgi:hypothetical protein
MPKPNSAPQVKRDGLHLEGYSNPIPLGSQQWVDWLQDSSNKSFRFEGQSIGHDLSPDGKLVSFRELTFTAVKSKNGKLWNAQKRVQGKLRGQYLGTPEELTWERMTEVALTLNSERYYSEGKRRGLPPKKADEESCTEELIRYKTVSNEPSQTCDEIEQLKSELEKAQQTISNQALLLELAQKDVRESQALVTAYKEQWELEANELARKLTKEEQDAARYYQGWRKLQSVEKELEAKREAFRSVQAKLDECRANNQQPSALELLSQYITAECGGSIPTDNKGKPKARYDQLAKFKHWLETR